MTKILTLRFIVGLISVIFAFIVSGQIGWNWGHEAGVKESKSAIEKSLELYNLGEMKYIELARETAGNKEANPEFAEKMWNLKNRQDQLLKDIWEFAKKLGIDTKIENIPLKDN